MTADRAMPTEASAPPVSGYGPSLTVPTHSPSWLRKSRDELTRLSRHLSTLLINVPLASVDDLTLLSLESLPTGDEGDSGVKFVHKKRRSYKGILFALLTGFLCAVGTLLSYEVTGSAFDVLFHAGVTITLISTTICIQRKENPFASGIRDTLGNIAGNMLTAWMWSFQYLAVRNMPYADAIVIGYISPIFSVIFSAIFLKERPRLSDGVTTVIMIVGFVLIAKPSFIFHNIHDDGVYPSRGMATVFAILSAATGGAGGTAYRMIKGVKDPSSVTLFFGLASIIVGTIGGYTIDTRLTIPIPCGWSRVFIILQGSVIFIAQYVFIISVSIERVPVCQILRSTEIVYSYVFQAIFFGITADLIRIGGSLLIISASIINGVKHIVHQRRRRSVKY